jgi:hypothetical protein
LFEHDAVVDSLQCDDDRVKRLPWLLRLDEAEDPVEREREMPSSGVEA